MLTCGDLTSTEEQSRWKLDSDGPFECHSEIDDALESTEFRCLLSIEEGGCALSQVIGNKLSKGLRWWWLEPDELCAPIMKHVGLCLSEIRGGAGVGSGWNLIYIDWENLKFNGSSHKYLNIQPHHYRIQNPKEIRESIAAIDDQKIRSKYFLSQFESYSLLVFLLL